MPDKYHLKYLEESIIEILIDKMKNDVESSVFVIIKTLRMLAIKSMTTIRFNIL